MLDKLTGMQVFERVAALGTLSGAARALGMSPTMATKHVTALEDQLGVKLVHRTTRKVTLTEAGRRYLGSVAGILAQVSAAEDAATSERLEVSGTLKVAVPVSFGILEIAPLMPVFARRHPALTVDLAISDRKVDLIEEGCDMAVRIGVNPDQTTIARKLAPCRTILASAPAYLEAHGTPRRVADLGAHNCLRYTLSSDTRADQWLFGPTGAIPAQVSGNLMASNGDVLVAAALAGQGIICEPTFLVGDHVRAGRLVQLHLDHAPREIPGIYATFPETRSVPARVRAFVDFLAAQFGTPPKWDRDLFD